MWTSARMAKLAPKRLLINSAAPYKLRDIGGTERRGGGAQRRRLSVLRRAGRA